MPVTMSFVKTAGKYCLRSPWLTDAADFRASPLPAKPSPKAAFHRSAGSVSTAIETRRMRRHPPVPSLADG